MLLPELQTMASSLGVQGTARMRKGELIAAIQELQGEGRASSRTETRGEVPARVEAPRGEVRAAVPDADPTEHSGRTEPTRRDGEWAERPPAGRTGTDSAEPAGHADPESNGRAPRRASRAAGPPEQRGDGDEPEARPDRSAQHDRGQHERGSGERAQNDRGTSERGGQHERGQNGQGDRAGQPERAERTNTRDNRDQRDTGRGNPNDRVDRDDDDSEGGRRNRRSRYRDRRGRTRTDGGGTTSERSSGGGGGGGGEPQVNDDDVLIPVAGIVDVLDNYAFVRTSGYLSGSNDVYVSMAQIKRYGLRRGDAVTGAVRTVRDTDQQGGRRDKYNPLIRLDTINGMDPEEARRRPEFYKLTPLYPQERLRLETEPNILTTRVIDLVMPIGKGQRALIVSPPKAGKTMVLQAIANAITHNNPECHLMVVLVDERPEEVTDMQRSVKGEVIASTFDRPPSDHTTVSELSIERAKRLVELGHDVVVLLDSITRLGRAYNNASPASGRILSGGIDSTALYPPKRFLGAARNIENGGSLTIIATALVETGSTGDTVIFEEFKGTGNAELKLDRKIADKRVFPAIDIDPSGTRKEEILLASDELAIVLKLRKVLHALDSQQALDLLLDRLKKTRTNIEFLMQIAKSTPGE